MRKKNYSWLMEAAAPAAAKSPDTWYSLLWEAIKGGAESFWNLIKSAIGWIFGKGSREENDDGTGADLAVGQSPAFSSLGQGVLSIFRWINEWILDPVKKFIMKIWKGSDGTGGIKKYVWTDRNYSDFINSPRIGNASIGSMLFGAAAVGLIVYGFYRLYKWWKNRKSSAKKALSEAMNPQSALSMGTKAASMVTPAMISSAFGKNAGNFFAACCDIVNKGGASAKVAEGTYRIMRNAGLKKKAAGRIARHTFSECIAQ